MATATRNKPMRLSTGRNPGTPNPKSLDQIRSKREHIYAALLKSAQAGDALAGRTCLELIGDIPVAECIEATNIASDRNRNPATHIK